MMQLPASWVSHHDHPILRGDEYVNCVLYIWKARMWSDFATKDLAKVDVCMKIHMYTYICIYRSEMILKWCVCVYMNTFGWVESEGCGSFYCFL